MPVKLAFVVPRYGAEIRGGAETGARMLAEHLVADRGIEVEVLTTCALDAITWRDELPEGTVDVNGVTRAPHPLRGRARRAASTRCGRCCGTTRRGPSREDMERWVDLQGPRSPALLDAVAASDADVVAFYPYLYYPTVRGLPLVAERAVLHPAAHEEPALHLPVFDELFARCRGFAFHSRSERALVNDRFGVAATPQVWSASGSRSRRRSTARRATARPPVPPSGSARRPTSSASGGWTTRRGPACCGAGSAPTSSATRARCGWCSWARWSTRRTRRADIVVTGMIDDAAKWALLRGARALVAPSPHESFSLTVVEALTAGVPVLVNAACGATREHCERSGAGLWFEDFAEFEAGVEPPRRPTTRCTQTMRHNGRALRGGELSPGR